MAAKFLCDKPLGLDHIVIVKPLATSAINLLHKFIIGAVHTDKQPTVTILTLLAISALIDISAFKTVNVVNDALPTTKIEVAHTEVNTLDKRIVHHLLESVLELVVYIIIDICHFLTM